jgi:hypothetical protein
MATMDINIGFSQALHLQCTRVSHWFGAIRKCSHTINCGIYIYIPFYLLRILWNSVYIGHNTRISENWDMESGDLGQWSYWQTAAGSQSLQSGKSTTFPHKFSFLKNIPTQISGWIYYDLPICTCRQQCLQTNSKYFLVCNKVADFL